MSILLITKQLHGQRIELTEIESAIRRSRQDQGQAAVDLIKAPDNPEQPVLAASIETPPRDFRTIVSELKATLPNVLPQHMVPRAYLQYDELPQSTAKKIDRQELRQRASALPLNELLGRAQQGAAGYENEHLTDTEVSLRITSCVLSGRFNAHEH